MAIYTDLYAYQGSYFSTIVTVESYGIFNKNLTGYTTRGSIKKSYASSTSIEFDVTITDAPNGVIEASLTSDITSAIKPGRYLYDIEIVQTSSGRVTRVQEGQIEFTPSVTSNGYIPSNIPPNQPILDGGIY